MAFNPGQHPALASWNIGGASLNWCSSCADTSSFWTPLKDNLRNLYTATGLVCLQETGPSFGRAETPPYVQKHFREAVASSDAAFHFLRGQTLIVDTTRWLIDSLSRLRKVFPAGTYDQNEKARKHWRTWVEFPATYRPSGAQFLMGMMRLSLAATVRAQPRITPR